jgi:hypothetical protein
MGYVESVTSNNLGRGEYLYCSDILTAMPRLLLPLALLFLLTTASCELHQAQYIHPELETTQVCGRGCVDHKKSLINTRIWLDFNTGENCTGAVYKKDVVRVVTAGRRFTGQYKEVQVKMEDGSEEMLFNCLSVVDPSCPAHVSMRPFVRYGCERPEAEDHHATAAAPPIWRTLTVDEVLKGAEEFKKYFTSSLPTSHIEYV